MYARQWKAAVMALGWLAVGDGWAEPITITDPAQGLVAITNGPGGGLGGITFKSGTEFFTVADSSGQMYPTTIDVDLENGLILSASLGTPFLLDGGIDLEGIAYDPSTDEILVSDESGPALRRHAITGGPGTGVNIPAVYGGAGFVANLSLESVSRQNDNGHVWIANEEALSVDGPLSTTAAGTTVRLSNVTTGQQWAYETDPIRAAAGGNERSGVADVQALTDDELLVLERELSGLAVTPNFFRNRIYLVDTSGATDVSGLNGLAGESFTKVSKSLLWEEFFINTNFEGITLGPQLNGGANTLVLISDDDVPNTLNTYILHLNGAIPEPASFSVLAVGSMLLLRRRCRR